MKQRFYMMAIVLMATIFWSKSNIFAQEFDHYFADKTLRVDYSFSGNTSKQYIFLDELNVIPRWYGKRKNLSQIPLEGNGQITVREKESGTII